MYNVDGLIYRVEDVCMTADHSRHRPDVNLVIYALSILLNKDLQGQIYTKHPNSFGLMPSCNVVSLCSSM